MRATSAALVTHYLARVALSYFKKQYFQSLVEYLWVCAIINFPCFNQYPIIMISSNSTKRLLAHFKVQSTSRKPIRHGPTQCIRTCSRCIYNPNIQSNENFEEDVALKCYDNLVLRKSIWFSQYQSIQYHLGQIDILKRTLDSSVPYTVYIVTVTNTRDLRFLEMVLDHANIAPPTIIRNQVEKYDMIELITSNKSIAIPIYSRSCVSDRVFSDFTGLHIDGKDEDCFGAKDLVDFFDSGINKIDGKTNLNIVNIIITKDHDRLTLVGLGSLCVQIIEPYTMYHYIDGLYEKDKSTHLVQHIYYDAAKGAAIFPSHIAAFLILFLEREAGVSETDLIEYFGWFRKISIDIDLHLGFTGEDQDAVKAGLAILTDFIHYGSNQVYRAKNIGKLMIYANKITPFIAYYGIVATAILVESNKDVEIPSALLIPGAPIKALRDKVLKTGVEIAQAVEQRVVCRKPCENIEDLVLDTLGQLQLCGKYLKIEEPVRNFDDDWDVKFDEVVYKTWIIVSNKDYKRDHLNLLINVVSSYLVQ